MKISRRNFIKAIGLAALSISPILIGCEKQVKKTIRFAELIDYEIITYETPRGNIALYTIYSGVGEYYALDLSNNEIDEYIIYDLNHDKEADHELTVHDNFVKSLNIKYSENAILSLDENIGIKDQYTAEGLQENLDIITAQLNKKVTKTL